MMNDEDPHYVTRCIEATASTAKRWIAEIILISALFTLMLFATASPLPCPIDCLPNPVITSDALAMPDRQC